MSDSSSTDQTLPGARAGANRKFRIPYVERVRGANGELTDEPRELKFYLLYSVLPDGQCGEIFIRGDKVGSWDTGILDGFASTFSKALQHGAPLLELTKALRKTNFAPSGFTGDPDFPSCTSALDLLAQYLEFRFPNGRLCRDPRGHREMSSTREDPNERFDCPNCTNQR